MSLFQNSVLNKYLKSIDKEEVDQAYQKFSTHFLNPTVQDNIRNAKEEQYQGEFLIDLFEKVLGYVKNPAPDFNLTTELKNVKDNKKADGAILKNEKAFAVIELKGTDTVDLGKIETQAFGYKNNQPGCIYIITSNFEKLRFYIDNAVDFEEFNLFELSKERFEILWLCLSAENLLKNLPKKIKEESLTREEQVTKKLYKDYSAFRTAVFQNISEANPQFNKLLLFKKTQKLLDRFLFIFFAEDRLLLPPNSIRKIIRQWKDLKEKYDEYFPLYERFKKYFGYLNTGHEGKEHNIFAYNGGLFAPDDILDNIAIDDEVLFEHTQNLSNYDFESEVSVNILGHIFEHSLTEIENIQAELEGQEIDKSKRKRKKDGVFYTPKYITKYIVENTVGKLCKEKKTELGVTDEAYQPVKQRSRQKLQKLHDYRDWLLQLTICDPACGSGAFLNQALEFLIAEHHYIDELSAKYNKDAIVLSEVENSILENNLFGVDINEESVEIAKLSLWLRTAEKGRKLTSLNNNIKCGNSLIDDVAVAGEKAFIWKNEFPEVFAKGGFDVIIGNPPYVKLETIKESSQQIEKAGYKTFDKRGDLYVLFVEKGFDLLKPKGIISYIMPNKWLQAGYGQSLRAYFLEKKLEQLIDFGDIQIFQGATTYPLIFVASNEKMGKTIDIAVLKSATASDFQTNVELSFEAYKSCGFGKGTWVISSKFDKKLIEKLKKEFTTLSEFISEKALRGVLTGLTEAFLINEGLKNQMVSEDQKSNELIFPFLLGREVKPFAVANPNNYILLIEKGFTKSRIGEVGEDKAWFWFQKEYPPIANWLAKYKERAIKRTDQGDFWWELRACDYYDDFQKPKVMYQKFQVKPCFIYDEQGLYCNDSMWIIPTEKRSLLGVLNSKMGWWLISKYCTQIQNGYQLIWKYFGQIPIPNINNELDDFVDGIMALTKEKVIKVEVLIALLKSKFPIEKPSQKLQNWHNLDFREFLKELEKARKKTAKENETNYTKLTLSEEAEWMQYFNEQKAKVLELQAQIDKTDREIDQMVYELYGLTEEEIEIVENS